ncbi:unnamed protein product [Aphanomyces euteiches]
MSTQQGGSDDDGERALLLNPRNNESIGRLQLYEQNPTKISSELTALAYLSVPLTFSLLMDIAPAFINMAIVGHLNSTAIHDDVNAVALSSMYINVTAMAAILGLAKAVDLLCSHSYASTGTVSAFGIYLQSGLLGMAIALVPVVVLNIFGKQVLVFLNQDPIVSEKAGVFLQYSAIGLPFLAIFELLKKLLLVQGITVPVALMTLLANIVHLALGYGLAQDPDLGLYGPAIARSVACVCLPIFLGLFLLWQRKIWKGWDVTWSWSETTAHLREFFHFGGPDMVSLMIEYGIFELLILLSGLLQNYQVVLGANAILINLFAVINMVCLGISMATTVRLSDLLRAYKPRQAKTASTASFLLTLTVAVLSASILVLLRQWIPKILTSDSELIECTANAILAATPLTLVCATTSVVQGVLWAVDKQDIANYVNAGGYYIVGMPLAAVFAFTLDWGLQGLWLGLAIGAGLNIAVYFWFLCGLNWKQAAKGASDRAFTQHAAYQL